MVNRFIYVPLFIVVPIKFHLNLKNPQNEIPMLLRSDYLTKDNVRPVKIVNVPVFYAFDNNNLKDSTNVLEENFTKVSSRLF